MGAVGLNAATREVGDHTQRLRVANAGWFRWAPNAAMAIATHLAGVWALDELAPETGDTPARRRLRFARAALTVAALVASAETGRVGWKVVTAGDAPVAAATQPIRDTPPHIASAQRRLRVAQWTVPVSTAALWLLNAWQASEVESPALLRPLPRRARP